MSSLKGTSNSKVRPVNLEREVILKNFLGYSEMASEGAMAGNNPEPHGLMRRKPIARKAGSTSGRISEHRIYTGNQIPENQIKIGGIRESPGDFVRKRKGRTKFSYQNYRRRQMDKRCCKRFGGVV